MLHYLKMLLLLFVLMTSCALTAAGRWSGIPQDLSIRGAKQVCTPDAVEIYTARLSASCTGPVQWTLSNSIGTLQVLTDSTVRIRFSQPGTAMLQASCGSFSNQIQLDYRPEREVLDLGNNAGICQGDTLRLQTGGAFSDVTWSDGSTGPELLVTRPGTYHALATNNGVCYQRDTVQISALAMPSAELPDDTVLCVPGTVELQANNRYINYQWQDGSSRSYLIVDRPGTYWVRVTNSFGCTTADTTVISTVAIKPQNFALFSDTAICLGEPVTLGVSGSYTRYNWNFGRSAAPRLQVSEPGSYTIEVYNNEGCSGIDTVVVADKGCSPLVYMPNAFTPNGDGLNDQLRARVLGQLDFFVLEVYNRWGGLVYRSSNPAAGWTGFYKGLQQPADTYVWQLRYRLPGATATQSQRGTTVLIR